MTHDEAVEIVIEAAQGYVEYLHSEWNIEPQCMTYANQIEEAVELLEDE